MKKQIVAVITLLAIAAAAQAAQPLKALLVTGGCCHDYKAQKDILKKGIEERANVIVDIVWANKDDKNDGSTKPALPILGNPDYAKGYDVVIHDECAAGIDDPKLIEAVLAPHRKGIPGVNLHCGMHCYRIGNPGQPAEPGSQRAMWFEYLGLQSSGHGPQAPITITHMDKNHPILKGLPEWTTINEELYNNIKILDNCRPLQRGKQVLKQKDGTEKTVETVVTWTSTYQNTRVFSTTIGHANLTVGDPRYLDLVTRGLLWACDKLTDDGQPAPGYGPKKITSPTPSVVRNGAPAYNPSHRDGHGKMET